MEASQLIGIYVFTLIVLCFNIGIANWFRIETSKRINILILMLNVTLCIIIIVLTLKIITVEVNSISVEDDVPVPVIIEDK